MASYSISDAKNRLSALLAKVRKGARIIITDRGVPVAVLMPVESNAGGGAAAEARMARLERGGVVVRGGGALPQAIVADRPPAARRGASAVALLLDERAEGR